MFRSRLATLRDESQVSTSNGNGNDLSDETANFMAEVALATTSPPAWFDILSKCFPPLTRPLEIIEVQTGSYLGRVSIRN